MDNNSHQNPPEETKIEELLSHFKPQPTSRFYERMRSARWQRRMPAGSSRSFRILNPSRRLVWSLLTILSLITVLGVAFIPPVRTIARQIFYSFIHAPSNQLDAQVTLTRPGDRLYFSDPANFPLNIPEVTQQAGFMVKEISILPKGLSFIGSQFDPSYNAVTLLYQSNNYKLFLTQRPLGNSQDVSSIGASAPVELVKIGGMQGEFVTGGWKATSIQPTSEYQTPERTVNITAIWDNDLPQSTLRWQVDGIAYELRCLGEGSPSQSQLILLANELK
jgi:hypothetical protein